MNRGLAGALCAGLLLAAAPEGDTWTFAVREGWSLSVWGERDLFSTSEADLVRGLEPRFIIPGQRFDPRYPPPTTGPRRVAPPAAPPAAPFTYRRTRTGQVGKEL